MKRLTVITLLFSLLFSSQAFAGAALDALWERADANEPYARYLVGNMFFGGQAASMGMPKDEVKAKLNWFLARQGGWSPDLTPEGLNKSTFDLYHILAEDGDAKAQFFVGTYYQNGEGVSKSESEALKWFLYAANQGYAVAQNQLGLIYKHKVGSDAAQQELIWFSKAAAQGDADGEVNLADLYRQGRDYISKDLDKALKWYRINAAKNDPVGQTGLGVMYAMGEGVRQDYNEALKWFRLAAEKNNQFAQRNIGLIYFNGLGVTKSMSEARKWLTMSAKQGNTQAQDMLKDMGNPIQMD